MFACCVFGVRTYHVYLPHSRMNMYLNVAHSVLYVDNSCPGYVSKYV